MGIQSNYLEASIADAILSRSTSIPAPATLYFALFTAMPDENGLNGQEVPINTTTGYQRRAVTNSEEEFPAVSDYSTSEALKGVKYNVSKANSIAFLPALSDWGDIVGFGIYDASTGGNLLISSPLDTARTVVRNDTMRFMDKELKFTEYGQTPENIMSFHMQKVVLDTLFGRKIGYQTAGNSDLYFSLFTTMPKPDEMGYAVPVTCTPMVNKPADIGLTNTKGIKVGMVVTNFGATGPVAVGTTTKMVDGRAKEVPVNQTIVVSVDDTTNSVTVSEPLTWNALTTATLVFTYGENFAGGKEIGGDCTIACSLVKDSDVLWVYDPGDIQNGATVTGPSIPAGAKVLNNNVTRANGDAVNGIQISAPVGETIAAAMVSFSGGDTGYGRVAVPNNNTVFPPYANGVKTNAQQVLWPACSKEWSQVKGMGIHDAKVGGNLLFKIPFVADRTFVTGEQPRLAAGALSIYLD